MSVNLKEDPLARATAASILRRGGQKVEFQGSGQASAADAEQDLTQKLSGLRELWTAPRVGYDLAAALWRPELGLAEVQRPTGKLLPRMGFMQNKRQYLHIEEALFLADRGDLLLLAHSPAGPQLLSLAEGTALMVASGVPLSFYLVYCHLMRASYTVRRHPAKWSLAPTEDHRDIWGKPAEITRQPVLHTQSPTPGLASPAGPLTAGTQAHQALPGAPPLPQSTPLPATSLPRPPPYRSPLTQQSMVLQRGWWGLPASLTDSLWEQLPRCDVAHPDEGTCRAVPGLQPFAGLVPELVRPQDDLLTQAFDIWLAQDKFSRKTPRPPEAAVCISNQCPPSIAQILATEAALGTTPLMLARVKGGAVLFSSLSGGPAALTDVRVA